ncbi:MAG: hypothetical protein A2X31_05200 [Elusimicrobia bacterium GWB2_63_22]|nr:MAG: hypothetical protein A2X31_05200 [Elusimicrobia bacterium GWB2_63_22]
MADKLKEFYSSSLEYRDSLGKNELKEYTEYLAECSAGMSPGGEFLECGCGLGNSSRLLSLKGFSVTGTDISPLFVEEARRRHGEGPLLRFAVEDASRMSFRDASFDVVCSALFMEHVGDVEAVLREMHRVLRPGGRLVLAMPSFLDPFQQLSEFLSWKGRARPRPWEAGTRAGAFLNFFYFSWIKFAKSAGLDRKIRYLEPVLSGSTAECGNDFDATWLANSHDVERLLLGLGMEVRIVFPSCPEGKAAGLMRRLRLPGELRRAYERTRAAGFTAVAVKSKARGF